MCTLDIYLNDIKHDDVNFDEDDPETIIHVALMAARNTFKWCKEFKKDISKELIFAAWHPTRWWDWCMPEDEKKEVNLLFIYEK